VCCGDDGVRKGGEGGAEVGGVGEVGVEEGACS
jgi:hypothetical protein